MNKIQGIKQFIYPVKDIAQANTPYSKLLGVEPYVDGAYYVGFWVGDQEIRIDPNGHKQGMTGPIGCYEVDDIKENLQFFIDAGGQVQKDVKDAGGGMLVAWVKDADGNLIGLKRLP